MQPSDLKVDVFSKGKFGEYVQVRITHIPTGHMVMGGATKEEHNKLMKYLVEKLERRIQGPE